MHAEPLHEAQIAPDPRAQLASLLRSYLQLNPNESETVERFLSFLADREDAFLRFCQPGHITGSALIIDPLATMTLLVHHRKLGRWLQPGGHCEAGETALQAAVREATEETDVIATPFSSDQVFDIDIHKIPDRPEAPAHLHYDVRFLLVAAPGQTAVSHESHAVEWVPFDEALRRNDEASISRMLAKAKALSLAKAKALSLAE